MADRSVIVRLRAEVGQFQAGMAKASASTRQFGQEMTGQGKSSRANIEAVGRGALLASGVMVVGFAKMIGVASGFEKAMSGVQAVSGASAAEMGRLSDAALAAGASTKLAGVTARDAAEAEGELVKAGVSVSDILGGALTGSLTLAAAGQIDFADAATIAAQAMNIFDLRGSQVTHVADVLAAAANSSAADVGGLGDALRMGGLVASQTGLSLEETTGALAAFADNALIGSDAGTSLKTMLARLTPQSEEAAKLMDELGFSAYDAQGNFIGLEGLAGELETALAGMTVEQRNATMNTLFGMDAVRGANVLYEEGAEGMAKYVEAVNDQGAAARMAAIENDNLSGDIDALGGALESALIETGSQANSTLRFLAQSATAVVGGFGGMPSLVQGTALGLGAIATVGAGAIGVIGTFGPKITDAKTSLEGMGVAGKFLSNNLGTIAKGMVGIGAGIAVFAAWETVMSNARQSGEEMSSTWRELAFDTSEFGTGLSAFKANLSVVNDEWGRMNNQSASSTALWDADKRAQIGAGADELASIGREMERVADLSDDLAEGFGISGDAALDFVLDQQSAGIDILAEDYDNVREALGDTFTTMQTGSGASQQLAAGMETLGGEVVSVEDQVKAFGETLDALFNQFFGVETAQDAFQSSLNELPAVLLAAAEGGLNLNDVLAGQSEEAITVRGHMREMVSGASALIAEWQEQGVTGTDLTARIAMLSQSFRDQAVAAGVPGPVVDHYLGLLGAIPVAKTTTINANTAAAEAAISYLVRARTVSVYARYANTLGNPFQPSMGLTLASGGSVPQHLAVGGPIYAAQGTSVGPKGTDTIPAWLSPGEFVVRKAAVEQFGVGMFDALNRGMMPGKMFAEGGQVGTAYFPPGGGGIVVNINGTTVYSPSLDPHAMARTVRDAIEVGVRRGIR